MSPRIAKPHDSSSKISYLLNGRRTHEAGNSKGSAAAGQADPDQKRKQYRPGLGSRRVGDRCDLYEAHVLQSAPVGKQLMQHWHADNNAQRLIDLWIEHASSVVSYNENVKSPRCRSPALYEGRFWTR